LSIIALAFFLCSEIWILFHAPQLRLGTFIVDDFFMPPRVVWAFLVIKDFFALAPPVEGVILAKVIFQEKSIRLKRGLQRIYFSLVKRIIKDGLSSSQMHAFRIGKPCFHTNMQSDFSLFIQIKLSFEVISWCLGCLSCFL
jgi:hypothetical protein